MKRLIVFINPLRWTKFEVIKTFVDEQHETNYLAYMKRKGYILDEVY